jgi:hypothetical protein
MASIGKESISLAEFLAAANTMALPPSQQLSGGPQGADADSSTASFGIGPNMTPMPDLPFARSPAAPQEAEGGTVDADAGTFGLEAHEYTALFHSGSDMSDPESSDDEDGVLYDKLLSASEVEQDLETIFMLADQDLNGAVDHKELSSALKFIGVTDKFMRVRMVAGADAFATAFATAFLGLAITYHAIVILSRSGC